jgi:hypothetical protein
MGSRSGRGTRWGDERGDEEELATDEERHGECVDRQHRQPEHVHLRPPAPRARPPPQAHSAQLGQGRLDRQRARAPRGVCARSAARRARAAGPRRASGFELEREASNLDVGGQHPPHSLEAGVAIPREQRQHDLVLRPKVRRRSARQKATKSSTASAAVSLGRSTQAPGDDETAMVVALRVAHSTSCRVS